MASDAPATRTLRLLLVGAPEAEATRMAGALEQAGWRVEPARADDEREVSRRLRAPLDLVLLWHRSAGPDPRRVLALMERAVRRVPVALVGGPEGIGEPLDLREQVERGVHAVVSADHPAQVVAFAREGLAARRFEEVVDLARAIGHDLNNLLAVIPLATRTLERGLRDDADRQLLDTVEQTAARATAAVDSLYQTALWSQGDADGVRGGVELRHLLEGVARRLRERFPDARVETDYPPDLGRLAGSPRELRQVFLCLALDALWGWDGEVAVRMAARSHPDGARVAVAVTGTGAGQATGGPLDPEHLRGSLAALGAELASTRSGEGVSHLLTLPLVGPRQQPST